MGFGSGFGALTSFSPLLLARNEQRGRGWGWSSGNGKFNVHQFRSGSLGVGHFWILAPLRGAEIGRALNPESHRFDSGLLSFDPFRTVFRQFGSGLEIGVQNNGKHD